MSESSIDVKYVANLARLDLNEEEIQDFTKQLNDIISFVKQLERVDTTNIEPTSHANAVVDVIREDKLRNGMGSDAALKNAPDQNNQQFKVTRVVE
ncbi:MAG: Asp-tRNA(Asn)/Glu-tRNA(Gln) amidotransferase subunit GatC [Verrucomicrobiales bacterium]|nr:Asp-tRNA(Asn)/Glu-tRNA(Gln) amidotransferase subunit GatC [Verrucomicrobiales bacterium]